MVNQERRKTHRIPFVASAEITEDSSRVSIGARVTDISRNGCYIDLRSPMPEGTSVRIRIMTATGFFEADATVGYRHPHLGMGLIFRNVSSESGEVLQKWMTLAAQDVAPPDRIAEQSQE